LPQNQYAEKTFAGRAATRSFAAVVETSGQLDTSRLDLFLELLADIRTFSGARLRATYAAVRSHTWA